MNKIDLNYYEYVLCDSIEALRWIKRSGLKKDTKILSSSPAVLLKDKKVIDLDKCWTEKKIQLLTESIDPIARKIFNKLLLNKKISKEEALVVVCLLNDYFKILYKAGSISKKILSSKVLNIKLEGKTGRKNLDINTPWEELFRHSKKFGSLSYKFSLENKKESFISSLKNAFYRIKFIDYESVIYKLINNLQEKKKYFKKNIFILGENELLKETVSHLAFNGFQANNLNIKNDKITINHNYKLIKKIIKKDLNKLTSKWVVKDFVITCEDIFFKNLVNELNNYSTTKENTLDYLSKIKLNSKILFSSAYLNSKVLGILNGFKKHNVPIISFQHGVTPEISDVSIYIASAFPANYCDLFVYFNLAGQNTAMQQAFIKSDSFVSGLPKKYFLTSKGESKKISVNNKILYLSMNLYRGFFTGFNGYLNDSNKAKNEINFIESVLSKIPYSIDYKPYMVENLRYLDKDPILEVINKYKNINLFDLKIDARFIISKYKVIITTSASSTLSWVLLSEKPVVFINSKNNSPLKEHLKSEIKEAIFYFEENETNYKKKLIEFMSQPIDTIEKLYCEKKFSRSNFIRKYFSKFEGGAGKRTKHFILKKYFN